MSGIVPVITVEVKSIESNLVLGKVPVIVVDVKGISGNLLIGKVPVIVPLVEPKSKLPLGILSGKTPTSILLIFM